MLTHTKHVLDHVLGSLYTSLSMDQGILMPMKLAQEGAYLHVGLAFVL
jgi:HD superfamily phosphodiesterase